MIWDFDGHKNLYKAGLSDIRTKHNIKSVIFLLISFWSIVSSFIQQYINLALTDEAQV